MDITPLQRNSKFSRPKHSVTLDNPGELELFAHGLGVVAPTPTDMRVLAAATSTDLEYPVVFDVGPRRLKDIADELDLTARTGDPAAPYTQDSADMAAIIRAATHRTL